MLTETYGGEIEMFVTDENGKLTSFDISSIKKKGIINGGEINYDSCSHLLELNVNVSNSLGKLIDDIKKSLLGVISEVQGKNYQLLNTSTFPEGTYSSAYLNNIRKIVYSLVRGPLTEEEKCFLDKLGADYNHRNWKHEVSSLFAGIQPWNSVEIENIEEIFKSLYVT